MRGGLAGWTRQIQPAGTEHSVKRAFVPQDKRCDRPMQGHNQQAKQQPGYVKPHSAMLRAETGENNRRKLLARRDAVLSASVITQARRVLHF